MADVAIDQIREALGRAKTRALAWTPTDGPAPTWQMAAAAIIALYENAIHEMECDGCAVKADVGSPIHIYRDSAGELVAVDFQLDKTTHRLRIVDEDEFSARVIIESK